MDDFKRIFRRSHKMPEKGSDGTDAPVEKRSRSFTRNLLPPRVSQSTSTAKRTVQLSAYHEPGSPDSPKQIPAPRNGPGDQGTRKRSTSRHTNAEKRDMSAQEPRGSESNVPPGTAFSPDSPTNGVVATPRKAPPPSERRSQSSSKTPPKTPSKIALASDSPNNGNAFPNTMRSSSKPRHKSIVVDSQGDKSLSSRFHEDVADRNIVINKESVPPVPKIPQHKTQENTPQKTRENTPPASKQGQKTGPSTEDVKGRTSTFTSGTVIPHRGEHESARSKTMSNFRLDGYHPRGAASVAESSGNAPIADQVGRTFSMRTSSLTSGRGHYARRTKWKNKFSSASYYALPEAPAPPSFAQGNVYKGKKTSYRSRRSSGKTRHSTESQQTTPSRPGDRDPNVIPASPPSTFVGSSEYVGDSIQMYQQRNPDFDRQDTPTPTHSPQVHSGMRPSTYPSSQYSGDQSTVYSPISSSQRLSIQNNSSPRADYNTTPSRSQHTSQTLNPPPSRSPPLPPLPQSTEKYTHGHGLIPGKYNTAATLGDRFSDPYDELVQDTARTSLTVPDVVSTRSSVSMTDDDDDAAKFHDASEYKQYLIKDSPKPIPLEAIPLDLRNTARTNVYEKIAKAVTHETILPHVEHITHRVIQRDTHNDHYFHRALPIIDKQTLPARHFVHSSQPGLEGHLVEVHEHQISGHTGSTRRRHVAEMKSAALPTDSRIRADSETMPGFLSENFRDRVQETRPQTQGRSYAHPTTGIPTTESMHVHPATVHYTEEPIGFAK